MKPLNNSEIAALIPAFWDVTANTEEEIIFCGKLAIREMVRSWRHTARCLSLQIKGVDETLKFLHGRNAAGVREVAQQYENPKFTLIGTAEDDASGELAPLDADSSRRARGATTFNVCGWCKHAASGPEFYNCNLAPSCNIKLRAGLASEFDASRFDTPCFLQEASDGTFDQIRAGYAAHLKDLKRDKEEVDQKIRFLLALEKRAERKPAMSQRRPTDWFHVDDPVVCYVGCWAERIVPNNFVSGKIIPGWGMSEGRLTVCYDDPVHAGPYLGGRGDSYHVGHARLMHAWEFEYLLKHPDFARFWLKSAHVEGQRQTYDTECFLHALTCEAAHRVSDK